MLWSSGGFTLRIAPEAGGRGRGAAVVVDVAAPFAVVGRAAGVAVRIDDPAVSSRHAYLHADARGLFAVDLATRTGTRVGAAGASSGWLRPGDRLEIAGREIELLDLRIDGDGADAVGTDHDLALPAPRGREPASPLDDTGGVPLMRLTLYPEAPPCEPLSLNSEMVFVGRSPACGVPVASPSAMRVQCVLVRGVRGAYAVDLVGRGTWVNDRPVAGAAALADGDNLMVGSSRFGCRVEAFGASRPGLPASLGIGSPSTVPSEWPTELVPADASTWGRDDGSGPPLHLIPPEAQAAVLGWMMGQIQGRQDEGIRRQAEFQTELVRLVAEIHRDNHAVLNRHLERADAIHRELSELRDELKRRFGVDAPGFSALSAPRPQPLKIAPAPPPESPEAAANWLIARVNQLDQENRKGWKDLLGRLSGRKED